MYIVGLTGGIASGKTAVSNRFAALGISVIDTDVIARELVEPGQPILEQVAAAFGKKILTRKGRLRRRKLREMIFSDPEKQDLLESILHPAIRTEARRRVSETDGEYCVVVIPLLTESGHFDWLDRVLVVDVPESTQVERLMARDDVTEDQARSSLAAQASREARLRLADDVIDNSGDEYHLDEAVRDLHETYLGVARGQIG